MEEFITIKNCAESEVVEKKSRFIACSFYIESAQEAEKIIKNIKKKNYNARHNCFAYRVIEKNINNKECIISKSSDDGEPSGTAGAPMLNILEKNKISNTLVIVTRYFGGILLGTGGLVKAYSEAINLVLEKSELKAISMGYKVLVKIKYKDVDNFKYYCRMNDIKIVNEKYGENVELFIEIKEKEYENLKSIMENVYKNDRFSFLEMKIIEKKYL